VIINKRQFVPAKLSGWCNNNIGEQPNCVKKIENEWWLLSEEFEIGFFIHKFERMDYSIIP